MSSAHLPVPRKVALTAVRGLLVGTSCTLALVAEDRRRRINNAIRVIENGEKIKNARSYHGAAGGLQEVDPITAAFLKQGAVIEIEREEGGGKKKGKRRKMEEGGQGVRSDWGLGGATRGRSAAAELGVRLEDQGRGVVTSAAEMEGREARIGSDEAGFEIETTRQEGTDDGRKVPGPVSGSGLLTAERPSWEMPGFATFTSSAAATALGQRYPTLSPETLKSVAPVDARDARQIVLKACGTEDPDSTEVAGAVQAFLSLYANKRAPKGSQKWLDASAQLCRTCQDLGLNVEAESVLNAILDGGGLDLEDYLAHNPLRLIRTLIDDSRECPKRTTKTRSLDSAARIFTVNFKVKPSEKNAEALAAGVELIEALFEANCIKMICNVFTRCCLYKGEDRPDLADWFISRLIDHGEYNRAIDLFLGWYKYMSLKSIESIVRIGDNIARAVESGHSYKPSQVLKVLIKVCVGICHVHLNWITVLFTADWNRYHDFARIEDLLQIIIDADPQVILPKPEVVYRPVMEIAFEAKDVKKAQSYLATAAAIEPGVLAHPHWLGIIAKNEARKGNWEEVRKLFSKVDLKGPGRSEDFANAFVPILKHYAQTHSHRETEEFLAYYTTNMRVPLCSYTVTFMMTQCGALRDFSGVVKWLRVCETSGLGFSADISNGLLTCCKKANMPFRAIRTLFRKLRAMNPDFVDKHTEKIMADLALQNVHLYGNAVAGRRARGRLLSLRLKSTNRSRSLAGSGRPVPAQHIVLAMKDAMVLGAHARALWIYKRALRNGMRPSYHALRLAVQAELNMPDRERNRRRVQDILRCAELHGLDVQHVTNQVIRLCLKEIAERQVKNTIANEVRVTVEHFERVGITLSKEVYNWAAYACLKGRRLPAALYYAHRAVEALGTDGKPCQDAHNFLIFLMCYVELLDVDKVRETIDHAFLSPMRENTRYILTLKMARRRAEMAGSASDVADEADEAFQRRRGDVIHALNDGIKRIVGERLALDEQRQMLEGEALRIMEKAALDMGLSAVDYDTIPWLSGKTMQGEEEEQREPVADKGRILASSVGVDNVKLLTNVQPRYVYSRAV